MKECCENCELLLELYKHPCNESEMFKGSVGDKTNLYVCTLFSKLKESYGEGCVFEENMLGGLCECYTPKRLQLWEKLIEME